MPVRLPLARTEMLRTIAAPILWSACVAMPTRDSGWFDGAPLGPIEAAAVALVWWAWAGLRRLPAARWLLALLVAKIALAGAGVERGFEARYYANDMWTAPEARSTEFRGRPYTRRDDRLAFGEGRPDLPLYFYNDVRFNYYLPTEPNRERLPYSAVWEASLLIEEDRRPAAFYVVADENATGGLWIDGRPVVVLDRASPRTGSVALAPGWHTLRISLAAPQGAGRRFEAGEVVGGTERPFDSDRVFVTPVGAGRLAIDAAARRMSPVIDTVMLAWLAALVVLRLRSASREMKIGRLLWFAAILEAIRYAWPYAGRVTVLGGGGDMLMYEHLARVILLGDPLLAEPGPGGGQGAPFYFQPLYPYFLALTHLVFGEDLFGSVFLQRLLVAATIASTAAITSRFFGARAGWVAVTAGGLFTYATLGRWSNVLLAEPLFTPILVAWVWTLIRLATEPPSTGRLLWTGVIGGTATLIRSTLLLVWPVILPLWWVSLRATRNRLLAVLLVTMIAIVGLATLRNWVVAERFVPVTTSVGINLYLGNEPTRPLNPPPPARTAIYDILGLEKNVRDVAEFAIQTPTVFARGLGNKALYSAGFFGWSGLPGGIGISWLYVAMWVLAAVGVARILRAPTRWSAAVWLPAAGALTHVAAVVLVFPHGYTDRLIVPLYPLLIPYAAYAVEPLSPAIIWVAARLRWALDGGRGWVHLHVVPVATPLLRQPRTWLYVASAAAASQSVDPLTALLLPVSALAVTHVTRQDLLHRIAAGTLWAAALVRVAAAGSLSPEAFLDPLFWGLMAAVALGASAIAGRWPVIAAATAAVAGGCTMVATLIPLSPGFEVGFPDLDPTTMGQSVVLLSGHLGPLMALCLLALWVQAIVTGGVRGAGMGRLAAAARGALVAALALSLAGAVPGAGGDARVRLVVLGILLGLVEAKARARRTA